MWMETVSEKKTSAGELKILEFTAGPKGRGGVYGINIAKVIEITARPPSLAELPNSHPAILGIVRVRDESYPIVDLARWMGRDVEESAKRRVILTEFNKVRLGFLVCEVTQIHTISWGLVEKPSKLIHEADFQYVIGMAPTGSDVIMLLDFERIISQINPATGITAPAPATPKSGRAPATVFIAEDSPFIRRQMAGVLSGAGYRVFSAGDGEEALGKLRHVAREAESKGIDIRRYLNVIVTDVEMPKMDGAALIARIREIPSLKDIPVVIFSSMADESNRRKWAPLKAAGVITKPEIGRLVEKMDALVFGAEGAQRPGAA